MIPGRLTQDHQLDWFHVEELKSLSSTVLDKLVLQFSMNDESSLPHGLMNSLISELRHLIYFMQPYFPSDSMKYNLSVNRNQFSIRPFSTISSSTSSSTKNENENEGMHVRIFFYTSMLKFFSI